MPIVQVILHLYALLLRLYPRRFRAEFAAAMRAVSAETAEDAARRGKIALITLCLRELRDMPISLLREHLHALTAQEIKMNSTAAKNAPGSWRDATLAGLPHVLYALMLYGPLLTYDLRTHGLTVLLDPMGNYPRYNYYGPPWFWPQAFWATLAVLVVVGLWRRVPRWSASWLGYG